MGWQDDEVVAQPARKRAWESDPVVSQTTPKQKGYTAADALGPVDAATHLASGLIAGPVSGLAGIASLPFGVETASKAVHGVQDAMTYQPRTKWGGEIADTAGSILSLPAQGADYVGGKVVDATGSPVLGTSANVGVNALAMLAGSRGSAALRNNAITRGTENSVKNATMRDAVDNRYVIPPSELAQSAPGKAVAGALESVAGGKAVRDSASTTNTRQVTEGARTDAAIPGRGQISEADMDAARAPHFQVYEEARAVSPTANTLVEMWRDANAERTAQNAFYRRSMNPEAQRAAADAGRRSDLLMQMIEAEAQAAGTPGAAQALRRARVSLGRIGSVDRALNESTGNVSARSLMQDQNRGAPLTGNMERAANVSRAFRDQLTKSDMPQAGISGINGLLPMLTAIVGGPKNLLMLGIPAMTRGALLSRPVQAMMRPPEIPLPIGSVEQLMRAAAIGGAQNTGDADRRRIGALLQLE